ncbi:MAG: hypothetical protein HYY01_01475 [Chloroflexi bacterium]|nr:hypothetical protein [Chloroflexota bacterium]
MSAIDAPTGGWKVADIVWKAILLGYLLGLLVTAGVGFPLLVIMESSWLLALAGSGGLFLGGIVTGRKVGPQVAALNATLAVILYNSTVALGLFIGWFLELLPEPLPGLPQGDSTFFFAWPLVLLVAGILGAVLGSRSARNRLKERS